MSSFSTIFTLKLEIYTMLLRAIIITLILIPEISYSQNIDIRLLRAINSPESLPSDNFFRFVSDSHAYIILGTNAALGVAGFIRKDDEMKNKALEMIVASAATLGISQAIKYTVNRERPFVKYPDIMKKTGAGDPSFPSGHTSAAFSAATSLSLSYPEWYVIVPSYAWAGTVGYSRMHLGAHYPSDVLAGALIGSGCAWLTHIVNRKLNSRK
jgi:membrane-associated phospholipid phosphatase